ncbi:MAG TPA: hypothetical protein VE567_03935 [Sphingomonas sp.]|nr:hypothetical protein [Sphingomonas sp.]
MLIAVALLQAAAPAQNAASVQPVAAPVQSEAAADAADAQPEPKMKRVCRKVMDSRVNLLSTRQTVCKFVPVAENGTAKR